MTDRNMYVLYAVGAIVVLGALWFYMAPGQETIEPRITPPAEQQQTPGGTTK